MIEKLMSLLNSTYSQFHTIENCKKALLESGYIELPEDSSWFIMPGGKYFVVRNDTSIIAFNVPKSISKDYHYQIIASHSDSPTFKLKANPILVQNGFVKLNIEKYGGMIYSCWLDRPLTIAGRVVVKKKNDNRLTTKLVYIDRDLLVIPNTAIHMNRDINNGFIYNPQIDLLPIIGQDEEGVDYFAKLMKEAGVEEDEEVISHDLFLSPRENCSMSGLNKEFISSPKLDNLECAYLSLYGLIKGDPKDNVIPVFACFDNEETGSMSMNGADSTFFVDILNRLSLTLGKNEEEQLIALSKSFIISADNAHGLHPNHPEYSDAGNTVKLNGGVVIKYNANMKYTSDGYSSAAIKLIMQESDIPFQEYENKSNMPGGSTLGNILQRHASIHTVDIGLAQLAMHSSYEVAGSKDVDYLLRLCRVFYSGDLELKTSEIMFNE